MSVSHIDSLYYSFPLVHFSSHRPFSLNFMDVQEFASCLESTNFLH